MSDIDGTVGMATYAAFALQQPLRLDVLEAAAEQAELPIATGAVADPALTVPPAVQQVVAPDPTPEHVAAMLAAAPELDSAVNKPARRITD